MANRIIRAERKGVTVSVVGERHFGRIYMDSHQYGANRKNIFRDTWRLHGSGVGVRGDEEGCDETLRNFDHTGKD